MTKEERLQVLSKVFSPSAPIKRKDFFFGRMKQLQEIVNAINENGQHAILHGERGVGKTSLANIMFDSITNLYPVKITCNKEDTFGTLWRRAFEKIQFSKTTKGIGFQPKDKLEIINVGNQISKEKSINVALVENLISKLKNHYFLFIFDEFDNIKSDKIRLVFADLLKVLSDNIENTTIVIVGISDNIEELIGSHQSLIGK